MADECLARLRSLCLGFPMATEKESWGHVSTFRVQNKILAQCKFGFPSIDIPGYRQDNAMTDQQPEFNQFNLVASDMEATVAFYRHLGLTIPEVNPEWSRHHRTAIMPGGIALDFDSEEFARTWNRGWTRKVRGSMGVLGFRVPSCDAVDRLYEELTRAGHAGQQPPYDAFWGARYAIVSDPDGNAVGLMSPVDPERRTMPTPP